MRPRGGSESTATTQHDPALNSWCALVGIGETEKPVMIFLWTLLIQLVDWTVIDAKWCATMATPAHPETRRFTRGLGKPGTAAELRQSVSEVVRTSVLVVSTHLKPPPPFLLSFFSLIPPRPVSPCLFGPLWTCFYARFQQNVSWLVLPHGWSHLSFMGGKTTGHIMSAWPWHTNVEKRVGESDSEWESELMKMCLWHTR